MHSVVIMYYLTSLVFLIKHLFMLSLAAHQGVEIAEL